MTLEIEDCEQDSCPYCGSESTEADSPDPDIGGRKAWCNDCGRHWNEGFVFTTLYIPDEYKEAYMERQFIKKNCTCGTKPDLICPVHDIAAHGKETSYQP